MKNLVRTTLLIALVTAAFSIAAPREAEAHRRWGYYRGPVYAAPHVVYHAPPVVYAGPIVAFRPRPILAPRRVWVAPAPVYSVPVYPHRTYYYGY